MFKAVSIMNLNSRSQYKLKNANDLRQLWMPNPANKNFRSGRKLYDVNKNQQTYGRNYQSAISNHSVDYSTSSLRASYNPSDLKELSEKINKDLQTEPMPKINEVSYPKFSQSASLSPIPLEKNALAALEIYNKINKDLLEKSKAEEKNRQNEDAIIQRNLHYQRLKQQYAEKESLISKKIDELKRKRDYEIKAYQELHQLNDQNAPNRKEKSRSNEISPRARQFVPNESQVNKNYGENSLNQDLLDTYNFVHRNSDLSKNIGNYGDASSREIRVNDPSYDINARYTKKSPKPQITYPLTGLPGSGFLNNYPSHLEDTKKYFGLDERYSRNQNEKSLAGYGSFILQNNK